MSKRWRASQFELPVDVLRMVLLYVTDSMEAHHTLRLVSKMFKLALDHPMMIANIKFEFYYPLEIAQLGLLRPGVCHLQLHTTYELPQFPLSSFPNLQTLSLSGACGLRTLDQLGDNLPVRHLDLSCCSNLLSIEGASRILPHLRSLDLTLNVTLEAGSVMGLGPLASLTHLEDVSLSFCNLTRLEPLRELVGLRRLDLAGCSELSNDALWDLVQLAQLVDLNLMNCVRIVDLQALSFLTGLETLNLVNCRMTDISPLMMLGQLRSLNVANCCVLGQLCHIHSLRVLNVNFCPAANSRVLLTFSELEQLHLGGAQIPNFRSLAALSSLRTLFITTCYRLMDPELLSLAALPALERLDLHECDGISTKGVRALTTSCRVRVTGSRLRMN
jgi:Leucine-rich repeat (LRR) protein